jgi:hypothetical protein
LQPNLKIKTITMKKFFAILAVAGVMVACNDSATTDTKANADSIAKATEGGIAADAQKAMDSAKNAAAAMADSGKSMMNKAADSGKGMINKAVEGVKEEVKDAGKKAVEGVKDAAKDAMKKN